MIGTQAGSTPREQKPHWSQFSLRTLLLLTTLVAVCLGLLRTMIALGILFAVAAAPALIRTVRAAARSKADGRPIGLAGLVGTFLSSLGLVASLTITSLGVLLGVCFAAVLWAVIVAASASRFLATCLAAVFPLRLLAVCLAAASGRVRWLCRRVMAAAAYCLALDGLLLRRFWSLREQ